MNNYHSRWTEEEDALLTTNYQLKKVELLKLFPNRTPASINNRASYLCLKKERSEYVLSVLDILLHEVHESYYWIGFLLADGSIHGNKLELVLSKSDELHINKYANYILSKPSNYKYNSNKCHAIRVYSQDKYIIPKIMEKFDWNYRKTYNPPDITKYKCSQELLMSLFIGYIDGDGCINKKVNTQYTIIRFRIHHSWITVLNSFRTKFNFDCTKPYIYKDGYCQWTIGRHSIQKQLKQHAITYNLPILNRKWDKITL